jgi:hypothetical protein
VQNKGSGKNRKGVAYGIYTFASVEAADAARALHNVVIDEWLQRYPDHRHWPLVVR